MKAINRGDDNPLKVVGVILGNVSTSVALILLNKLVMNAYGFKYVFSLSLSHMIFTGCSLFLMGIFGRIDVRHMSVTENLVLAASNVGSICFMNLSLERNSLGFYQVCKLLCIPCIVMLEKMLYGARFSGKIKASLMFILGGVGIATVTDIQITGLGLVFGALAVTSTAVCQILMGRKQKEHNLDAFQIMRSVAFYQIGFTALCVMTFELQPHRNVLSYEFTPFSTLLILCTCPLALCAQLFMSALVRVTSAVTYQVVGHSKTCLIFIFGFLTAGYGDVPSSQLLKNLMGVLIAMGGVVLYGNLKMAEKNEGELDWCDKYMPTWVLGRLAQKRYEYLTDDDEQKV